MTYGPEDFVKETNVSRETLNQLRRYADDLVKWQKAKNLVANSTLDDRWRRHFLDSAQLFQLIRQNAPKASSGEILSILDIGSGAGFPGLVLSIMGLGAVSLVEANGRKCVFMNQIARLTGAHATVINQRIEAVPASVFDIITSRACAKVVQLLDWAEPFIGSETEMWLLKGEGVDEELTQAAASWNMNCERFQSRSSPDGVVLRLYNINKS